MITQPIAKLANAGNIANVGESLSPVSIVMRVCIVIFAQRPVLSGKMCSQMIPWYPTIMKWR